MDIRILFLVTGTLAVNYPIDDSISLGRQFDGIGALSGGGATSKLLVNYPEKYRNEILDYLFKPNFGASLHILKVEIGGDADSTEGTESSHMHEENDENYERGYEWWLMLEAKKRNPNIKLYGLPWGFPGWVGEPGNPYAHPEKTAMYVAKWIKGASSKYGLVIDYVGIWNERYYNKTYIETLRKTLDMTGLSHVKIVASDASGGVQTEWKIADDILKDPTLAKEVDIVGVHYPGTTSTPNALKTGKPLWASEEYATYNDIHGGACLARILNQNYVEADISASIIWNLIASYYESLLFGRHSLMTAEQPWSGNYVVESPIWVAAHTTQFVQRGWKYLSHAAGVGTLNKGGSYVSLVSPDKKEFTLILETMVPKDSACFFNNPPPGYNVVPQNATFMLKGTLASIQTLNVWCTKFNFNGQASTFFKKMAPMAVKNGQFTLNLDVNTLYTLSTVNTAMKGMHPAPPKPRPFPLPYSDTFESYPINSEAYYLTAQVGVWEVQKKIGDSQHGNVYRQVVRTQPIDWCGPGHVPVNIIGNVSWSNILIKSDVMIPTLNGSPGADGAFLALRMNTSGGCALKTTDSGIFLTVFPRNNSYKATTDFGMSVVISQGKLPLPWNADKWATFILSVRGSSVEALMMLAELEPVKIFQASLPEKVSNGFAAIGTTNYGWADFDNFMLKNTD